MVLSYPVLCELLPGTRFAATFKCKQIRVLLSRSLKPYKDKNQTNKQQKNNAQKQPSENAPVQLRKYFYFAKE